MAHVFQCDVVTAEKQFFTGNIQSIVVPGMLGEMGIHKGHSPLITKIKPGVIRIKVESVSKGNQQQDTETIFYVSGGFIEVVPGAVTVLAEKVMRGKDIDEAAAMAAKRHAEELMTHPTRDMDYARAMSQLAQAIAQLRTLHEFRKLLGKG